MARVIHLRLVGKAEAVVSRLMESGLTEQDIISRALWLLDQAATSGKVAMLDDAGDVQYMFGLETKSDERRYATTDARTAGDVSAAVERGRQAYQEAKEAAREITLRDDR